MLHELKISTALLLLALGLTGCSTIRDTVGGWWGQDEAPTPAPATKPAEPAIVQTAPQPKAEPLAKSEPLAKPEPTPREDGFARPVVKETDTGIDSLPEQETFADRQLARIVNEQEAVFASLQKEGEDLPKAEYIRRVRALLDSYQTFIDANPEYVPGLILYGKLLRKVEDYRTANIVFLKANELDPNIAVVKQQIGNYLAEEGKFELALPYFLAAVELEPSVALYHYQLGEMIWFSRQQLVDSGSFTKVALDKQMLEAFRNAAELAPDNRDFQMRYGEAFFDVQNPDWTLALEHWDGMLTTPLSDIERDILALQKARVLIKIERFDKARALLETIERSALESSRQKLLSELPPT